MADRIDISDLLTTDLARMWRSRRKGTPWPAPPADPVTALALAEAHDRAGDQVAVGALDPDVAVYHWRRATECRAAAGH